MEFENITVDPIHIFKHNNYTIGEKINNEKIHVAVEKNTNQFFFLLKKGEKNILKTNKSFIDHLEKSFELIHPSIINLSGYTINKQYLYYKHFKDYIINIEDIQLSDENIQKIFLGIASGLSYLLTKEYYFPNFSFDCVIFDSKFCPRLIDYINFEDEDKTSEKDLILKYADVLQTIIKKKMEEEPGIPLNEEFKSLIERCAQKTNIPTFDDFINFLISTPFRGDFRYVHHEPYQRYLKILQLCDKIIFDDFLSRNNDSIRNFDSIEQICYYFFKNNEKKKLENDDLYLLNSLPEYYIKPLAKICPALSDKLSRYLFIEDTSLVIPNWKTLHDLNKDKNPFKIYKVLMKNIKILENQRKEIFDTKKTKEISYKIESLRIQAIFYLKKASKQSEDAKINIELAVQYIKGKLLPYNLEKAFNILDSISIADQQTKTFINQIKEKTRLAIKSIKDVIQNLNNEQKEKVQKAEGGDILSLFYVGFAFYTGFNGFPILHSLSIQYYRMAAKKSPDAMTFLGYLYFNGIFFPQNFRRAVKCFKRAADGGSLRAEIIDCFLRKHLWRNYLVNFQINDLFNDYIETFQSTVQNISLLFSKIIYYIESNKFSNTVFELELSNEYRKTSFMGKSNIYENSDTFLTITYTQKWDKKIKPIFSEKIIMTSEKLDSNCDVNRQLFIAKSYFHGNNNFPVNYTKAAKFFRLAADNGDPEAQLYYALLNMKSIGDEYDLEKAKHYFQESAKQNNIKGKLYYAIFEEKCENNSTIFKKLIKECCDSNDASSLNLYAMHLENNNSDLNEFIDYYKKAAELGHYDSLIKLLNILEGKSFEDYLELSIGMFNEDILTRLIKFYDERKRYDQSNILIQIGIKLNSQLFNAYYIDHLLYGKGIEINIKKAKNLAILTFKETYLDNSKYVKKYIVVVLQALVVNNEHEKALKFLLQYQKAINESDKEGFLLFYKNFDKSLAKKNYIPAYLYFRDFKLCHELLLELQIKSGNFMHIFTKLLDYATNDNNSFAFAIIGKMYKQEKYIIRDLKLAIKYFARSVELKCPLGYYYLGKNFFYGRFLEQNFETAKKYLILAVQNNEPRACYYLFKTLNNLNDKVLDDIGILLIGVEFGHKRAIYEYGKLLYKGKNDKVEKNESEGIKFIQQTAFRKYTKAIKFCIRHGISFTKNKNEDDSILEDDSISADDERRIGKNQKHFNYNTEGKGHTIKLIDNDEVDKSMSDSIEFWL